MSYSVVFFAGVPARIAQAVSDFDLDLLNDEHAFPLRLRRNVCRWFMYSCCRASDGRRDGAEQANAADEARWLRGRRAPRPSSEMPFAKRRLAGAPNRLGGLVTQGSSPRCW